MPATPSFSPLWIARLPRVGGVLVPLLPTVWKPAGPGVVASFFGGLF